MHLTQLKSLPLAPRLFLARRRQHSWGLNASGQLGNGDTEDRGDEADEMGDMLPAVQTGMRIAFPPALVTFDEEDLALDEEGDDGLSTVRVALLCFSLGLQRDSNVKLEESVLPQEARFDRKAHVA